MRWTVTLEHEECGTFIFHVLSGCMSSAILTAAKRLRTECGITGTSRVRAVYSDWIKNQYEGPGAYAIAEVTDASNI